MKWLYRLEYKFGRHYIRHLMTIIVAGMGLVYVLQLMVPALHIESYLVLTREALAQWQLWRLVTFLFVPPGTNAFFLIISLYFYYIMGTSLESAWGGFRLNVYYFIGILGAIAAALITGIGNNTYLNLSLFLAFATIAPDTRFMLFFILPIKAKWMAIAYGALLAFSILNTFLLSWQLGLAAIVSLAFSLVNYFLFFGRSLIDTIKNQIRIRNNRRNWNNRNR